jgi:hypothetical protein
LDGAVNPEEQQQENRRRIGELAMGFMDDLEEEFEEPVLVDFAIVAEIGHGGPHERAGEPGVDVATERYSIRYRSSSWRPMITSALFHQADQLISPYEPGAEDGD